MSSETEAVGFLLEEHSLAEKDEQAKDASGISQLEKGQQMHPFVFCLGEQNVNPAVVSLHGAFCEINGKVTTGRSSTLPLRSDFM